MKPELILQADLLDIVFDGRNKDYGAYQLRRDYEARIRKAMLFVLALTSALFLFSSWNGFEKPTALEGKIVVVDTITLLPPPPAPPPPVEHYNQRSAITANPSFVLTSADDNDTMPTVDDLSEDVQIGLKKNGGESFISDAPPPLIHSPTTSEVTEEKKNAPEEILKTAEVMPEFPGGQAAFMRFWSKHLRVPENSLEPGQKIKVIIRFVVDKEGGLSDMQFLQSGGEVFEHEVLRVLKKMPRWSPGTQNGEKVRVFFNLPIIFDSPDE